jgi:hypothetical protein
MENFGIFFVHLEHFTAIWYILWSFGNVVIIWYGFHHFGVLCQEKSGNPGLVEFVRKAPKMWPNAFFVSRLYMYAHLFLCSKTNFCPFIKLPKSK